MLLQARAMTTVTNSVVKKALSHNGPLKCVASDVRAPAGRTNVYIGMHKVCNGHFHQPVCYTVKGFVSGGDLVPRAIYAAHDTVANGLRISGFRCTYFLPVTAGSLDFFVQDIFDARTSAERHVRLVQNGKLKVLVTISFRKLSPVHRQLLGSVESAPLELRTSPEHFLPYEALYERFVASGGDPTWPNGVIFNGDSAFFDVRPLGQMNYLIGPESPTFRHCTWNRVPHENPGAPVYLHDLHLVMLSAVQILYVTHLGFPGTRFSLMVANDLNGWFHEHSFDTTDFLLLEMECTLNYGLNALVVARFWSRNGQCLATLTQEGTLVPEMANKPSRINKL